MARAGGGCVTRAYCPGPSSGALRTESTSAILTGTGPRAHCCLFLDFFPLGTLQKMSRCRGWMWGKDSYDKFRAASQFKLASTGTFRRVASAFCVSEAWGPTVKTRQARCWAGPGHGAFSIVVLGPPPSFWQYWEKWCSDGWSPLTPDTGVDCAHLHPVFCSVTSHW